MDILDQWEADSCLDFVDGMANPFQNAEQVNKHNQRIRKLISVVRKQSEALIDADEFWKGIMQPFRRDPSPYSLVLTEAERILKG